MAKVYNTFEFVGNLSIPKETEKFKPYKKDKYESGWVKESLKVTCRIPDSSENITIEDMYADKPNHSFERDGVGKKENGTFTRGAKIKINWNDRNSSAVIEKVAAYQRFTLDTSNNKERYIVRTAIEKLEKSNDDTETENIVIEANKNISEYIKLENELKSIDDFKNLLTVLEDKKKEYLSRVDMIQDLKTLIGTTEGTNTVFKISGDMSFYQNKEGKVYKTFSVKRIEKALPTDKLKLNGHLDMYFNSESLDEDSFEDTKKYIVNAWTKTYDGQLKQDIYIPLIFIADGSKLDLTNEKHLKRINGLVRPFKDKSEDTIYQIQYEVKFANGKERVELTFEDLTDFQKELVEDGVTTVEEIILDLGGNKLGERIDEIRLFKVNFKDFNNGAEETELTMEDMIVDKSKLTKDNTDEKDNTDAADEEDDIDDLI